MEWNEASLAYAQFHLSASRSYRDVLPENVSEELLRLHQLVRSISTTSLRDRAKTNDPDAILELGVRTYHGCEAPKSTDKAQKLWEDLILYEMKATHRHASRRTGTSKVALAHSYLAHVHYDKFQRTHHVHDLIESAMHANRAMYNNLPSPITLLVAGMVIQVGQRHTAPFNDSALFGSLWDGFDARSREVAEEDRARHEKVRRKPNAYVCAACGIRATVQGGLKKCAGSCEPEWKPSYCSKECQRADWKSHKPQCKKGIPPQIPKTPSEIPSTDNGPLRKIHMSITPLDGEAEARSAVGGRAGKRNELRMSVPHPDGSGRPMEIMSQTLDPAFMREFQQQIIHDRG